MKLIGTILVLTVLLSFPAFAVTIVPAGDSVTVTLTTGPKGDAGPQGVAGPQGADGHSPTLTWSGDQIAIDGSVTGPHLTGPSGGGSYATTTQGAKADTAVQPPTVTSTLMGWADGAWTGIRAALDSVYHGMAVTWAEITGKPTTLAGYGITDAEPKITAGTTAQYLRGDKSLATFPTLGTAAAKDVPASGNASASQVVYGTDTRLSDARTPLAHNQDATTITTGTIDGDRLPAMSTTKKGAVPATGTPSGKYLKDDGTWATVASGTTTKAAAYPSTDDNYGVTAAYLEAALNSGFTISTSDATQKGKPAMWDASTGELKAATNGALAAVLPTCSGTDKLTSNGTVISCTADQTGTAGTGITSLNGASVTSQTFADGANIHVTTNTGTGAHTIGITGTIPDGNIASSTSWNAKLDPATAASTYHTKAAFNSYSAAQAVKLAGKMNDTSSNPDGTHYVWAYNTTACPASASTPVGALCTLPGGIYQNTGSAWVVPPDVSSGYSLPTASTSTLGGIKVGSGLAIDGSGVLSATGGGGSGLTVVAPFSGTQTVAVNNRYTTTATSRLTFSGHAAGTTTILAKADTTLVPDASSGVFSWLNPITRASTSTTAGYSALLKAGTYADIVSNGDGTFQINANANPQATGVNEYAGGGGGGGASYTDSFPTDGNPAPGSWVTVTSESPLKVASGAMMATVDSTRNGAYYNAAFTANQYSQITAPVYAGKSFGVIVRCSTSAENYYQLVRSDANTLKIYKITGAGYAQLGSDYTQASTAGEVLKLAATGTSTTTLTPYLNGTALASVTDSSSPFTSGKAGIVMFDLNFGVDNWAGGDL